jgi:hypothetical protein
MIAAASIIQGIGPEELAELSPRALFLLFQSIRAVLCQTGLGLARGQALLWVNVKILEDFSSGELGQVSGWGSSVSHMPAPFTTAMENYEHPGS